MSPPKRWFINPRRPLELECVFSAYNERFNVYNIYFKIYIAVVMSVRLYVYINQANNELVTNDSLFLLTLSQDIGQGSQFTDQNECCEKRRNIVSELLQIGFLFLFKS